jgi:ABC-type metal ion transport system substrate-binding protein
MKRAIASMIDLLALVLEEAARNPYANVLVTTPGPEHDPRIQRLRNLLTSTKGVASIPL